MHLYFKKWLQVFPLDPIFGDKSSIIFLLTNYDTMVLSNSYIITRVKDVYQFSQSIAKQKNKR